ncbi:MAG TPA: pyridoxal 5'-phosphate synthase [Solirubrobacteraceae bacterium]|nr:pyridoxal 5'-phosphate synthase [Solirubrobacteraceae bacterium]
MDARIDIATSPREPLELLGTWLAEARERGVADPHAVTFVTVGEDARPSARTVSLKRLHDGALIFTSALWTRKAREIAENAHVALLFYWPSLGRQVHVAGDAVLAERSLGEELFAERDPAHRMQTIVSRQGEPIEDIAPLRERHAHLLEAMEAPPDCPPDWGAIRVTPSAVEFWLQSDDRIHDRLLYTREQAGWALTRLAP